MRLRNKVYTQCNCAINVTIMQICKQIRFNHKLHFAIYKISFRVNKLYEKCTYKVCVRWIRYSVQFVVVLTYN